MLVELPQLLDDRPRARTGDVDPERPDGVDDEVPDALRQQWQHRQLRCGDPERLVVVVGRLLLRLGTAEHRLALGHVDQDVRRLAPAVGTLEQATHHGAAQRALLGQLTDRGPLGGLTRVDAAARQHGVLVAVEDPGHHQHRVAADDHGDRARLPATQGHSQLRDRRRGHFLPAFSPLGALERAAMKASCGTSTRPTIFIRFLPSFCFSSSLRLRVMSPP